MSSTDVIEMIQWAFPVELIELELLIDPPIIEVRDYDYNEFYDIFLQRAIQYLENLEHKEDPDTILSMEKRHSLRSLGVRLPPLKRN